MAYDFCAYWQTGYEVWWLQVISHEAYPLPWRSWPHGSFWRPWLNSSPPTIQSPRRRKPTRHKQAKRARLVWLVKQTRQARLDRQWTITQGWLASEADLVGRAGEAGRQSRLVTPRQPMKSQTGRGRRRFGTRCWAIGNQMTKGRPIGTKNQLTYHRKHPKTYQNATSSSSYLACQNLKQV